MLSKILLVVLLGVLLSKLGWRAKLKQLGPRVDRGVNLMIIGLSVIYVGHLAWWLLASGPR